MLLLMAAERQQRSQRRLVARKSTFKTFSGFTMLSAYLKVPEAGSKITAFAAAVLLIWMGMPLFKRQRSIHMRAVPV
ncbi:hypothetical protein KOXM_28450 [Klebsiella michiganensis]|nr:hypothetical protein KOXM_28450 [Klebsiella michiganensis]KZT45362.1 hypothetical protein A6A30_20940 [Klebsiella michiganensis]